MVKHLSSDERARLHAAEQAASAHQRAAGGGHGSDQAIATHFYPIIFGAIAAMAVLAALALFWPALSAAHRLFCVGGRLSRRVSFLFEWLPLRLMLIPKRAKHGNAGSWRIAPLPRAYWRKPTASPDRALRFAGRRYVEIVTDHDVHLRVPQAAWDAVVADLHRRGRKGRVADGIVGAVEACAKVLETHYPVK